LADSLPRFLAVVSFVVSSAEHSPAQGTEHAKSHAQLLSLEALSTTPYQGSVWLLSSGLGISFLFRRHAFAQLRC
jgi:hypothetical protein